jgi:ABC-type bacteriocin/lantibiotic exporter with double-glycine peptidase domain
MSETEPVPESSQVQSLLKHKPTIGEITRSTPFVFRLLLKADKRSLAILMICAIAEAPIASTSLYAIKNITDGLMQTDVTLTVKWGIALLVASLIGVWTNATHERRSDIMRFNFILFLRKKNLRAISRLPIRTIEDPAFQELSQALREKQHASFIIQEIMTRLPSSIFSLIGMSAIFIFIPWQAIIFVLLALVARFIAQQKVANWNWDVLNMETREGKRARYYENTHMYAKSASEMRILNLSTYFIRQWSLITRQVLDKQIKTADASARALIWGDGIRFLGFVVGLAITAWSVFKGQTAISAAVVFITMYNHMSRNVWQISHMISRLQKDWIFLPLFKRFYAYEPEQRFGERVPRQPLVVEFKNVSFAYPGSNSYALHDINLTLREGEHIALAGKNTAGKSTLLRLLAGIYEPSKGEILVNGTSLAKLRPTAWRRALAYMSQGRSPFDDTIRNQVHYGQMSDTIDEERFAKATRVSCLDQTVEKYDKGYETHAGKHFAMPEDNPIELSGGQLQSLAIARTLYRRARIYVFDEPTSSLDADKERQFFRNVPDVLTGRLLIYVSHREDIIRRAKRIIFLDEGRIIADGQHNKLIREIDQYASLFSDEVRIYN